MKLPSWNLKDLYASEKDPKVFSDLSKANLQAKKFAATYKKAALQDPKKLLAALKQYEAVETLAAKPVIYANLLFAESAKGRGAFLQSVKTKYSDIHKTLTFFELAIVALPVATLKALATQPILKNYHHYLSGLLISKRYRLSEESEKLITDKSLSGRSAWVRFFDETFSRKKFLFSLGKESSAKDPLLSETEVLSKLYSADRIQRQAARKSLTSGLVSEIPTLTFITNTLIQDKVIEDSLRGYEEPESSRHLANEISSKTVETMCKAVEQFFPTVQKFYRLKAKCLKTKVLYDYDRYAPLAAKERKYSYAEAKSLVLDSFSAFSPGYAKIAKEFFDKQWIDFADREGKRGGAFCSFVTPDRHPYVFMNYNGNVRDVFTLAHELGHGIHAYLMREQTLCNFDTPLTIAETASAFAEMLLFEQLKKKTTDKKERFFLIAGKLESIFATVFRQVSMYRFEQDIHYHYCEHGELSTEQTNAYWRARQVKMFGNSVTLTPEYDYWWSYIPHFIHTPFYVYAYAFGELLTLALFAKYQAQGDAFVPEYLKLLATDGSKTPKELLKPLNINLESPTFWSQGLKMIDELLAEAESLVS